MNAICVYYFYEMPKHELQPQFYIQLLFKPHLGTWILPFGLLGSKWAEMENFWNDGNSAKVCNFFCPQKVEKTTSKSCLLKQKFRRFRNFSFTAQQPKWQNSCSQMWLIEQLYIELGILPSRNQTFCEFLNRSFHQHYSARASPKLVKNDNWKDTKTIVDWYNNYP